MLPEYVVTAYGPVPLKTWTEYCQKSRAGVTPAIPWDEERETSEKSN